MQEATAEGALRAATARRKRAERNLAATRRAEATAARQAIESKALKQSEVVAITGYTREHIRRITNAVDSPAIDTSGSAGTAETRED